MNFYSRLQHATERERAELHVAPIIADVLAGSASRQDYLAFLQRAFHHVRHTVPLFMACASRLPKSNVSFQQAIAHYIAEEQGHEKWIHDDIAAAGGDARSVADCHPDRDTELMVAYAYDTVMRGNPLGLFGMVYVLEGTSVGLATTIAGRLRETLQLPANALTYLTSHGDLDISHIAHFERLMNQLENTEDQRCVIHCARMFFHLYGNVLRNIRPSRSI
jgi:heme oxygenase